MVHGSFGRCWRIDVREGTAPCQNERPPPGLSRAGVESEGVGGESAGRPYWARQLRQLTVTDSEKFTPQTVPAMLADALSDPRFKSRENSTESVQVPLLPSVDQSTAPE
jgi:hypothetical protein